MRRPFLACAICGIALALCVHGGAKQTWDTFQAPAARKTGGFDTVQHIPPAVMDFALADTSSSTYVAAEGLRLTVPPRPIYGVHGSSTLASEPGLIQILPQLAGASLGIIPTSD